ncbi:MAG: hypothetical protein EOS81_12610 [Mesorhizobium sp.]|uniref:hypothetical protein n=1 Tax=unclassified Mesorhizobium TaxID=325217 RepID=UPI000F74E419|nr:MULTISPECIES: hypothetical protein [unclassified Mesorhizobium]RVC58542.1 hypothetical protein EN759_34020 [Mesorhizobium sp. M00.F.Ca.ET.038.03.1.1]RVC72301.1 hypothetical protein EN766_24060 [Mesorhizobium sp. M2A.F.Ca.ET.046.02.1.1]AZO38439.1 hypothetical protein EJ072_31295 [Mesorhizobium sp. M2A.F.Ca.ET.046.03.2.1]RWB42382.1 MAG: hypothetical protein EOQ44_21330 [Mesorhizobium sp.]RWE19053.1 MAG: hypothetical protein EOS76_13465 [Mesorhizobium sp.]
MLQPGVLRQFPSRATQWGYSDEKRSDAGGLYFAPCHLVAGNGRGEITGFGQGSAYRNARCAAEASAETVNTDRQSSIMVSCALDATARQALILDDELSDLQ